MYSAYCTSYFGLDLYRLFDFYVDQTQTSNTGTCTTNSVVTVVQKARSSGATSGVTAASGHSACAAAHPGSARLDSVSQDSASPAVQLAGRSTLTTHA